MEHLTIVNEVAALLLSRVRTLLFLSPSRIEDILAKLLPPSPLLSLRRTLQRFRASLVGPAMELANLLGIVSRKLISAPRVTPAAQWLASYKIGLDQSLTGPPHCLVSTAPGLHRLWQTASNCPCPVGLLSPPQAPWPSTLRTRSSGCACGPRGG